MFRTTHLVPLGKSERFVSARNIYRDTLMCNEHKIYRKTVFVAYMFCTFMNYNGMRIYRVSVPLEIFIRKKCKAIRIERMFSDHKAHAESSRYFSNMSRNICIVCDFCCNSLFTFNLYISFTQI